jgi:hypothetical protein
MKLHLCSVDLVVVLLAAAGHQHGVVVGAKSFENVLTILTLYLSKTQNV